MSGPPVAPDDPQDDPATAQNAARRAAFRSLAEGDPLLARALAEGGEPHWREGPPGFAGICRLIAGQQISTHAARALWARVEADPDQLHARGVAAIDPAVLRATGWSRPRIAHLKAVAAAELSGALDFARISTMPDDEALAALVAIRGIGPWTARLYLMFCDQRNDLIPDNDLALHEALRILSNAGTRLRPQAFAARAAQWRPFRTAAALMLWNFLTVHRRVTGRVRPAPG